MLDNNIRKNSEFEKVINGRSKTLLPKLHLQQISLFMFRQGIELFFTKEHEELSSFIKSQWKFNDTDLYLDEIWKIGAITGEVCLYIFPHLKSNNYRILFIPKQNFKPYYNDARDLEKIEIQFEFYDEKQTRRVKKFAITNNTIYEWKNGDINNDKPEISYTNPYGFIPVCIIQNYPSLTNRSKGEFEDLQGGILEHDWFLHQLRDNLEFFGGPIFYSSRSKNEMIEAGLVQDYHSIASDGGYRLPMSQTQRIKARRIFSNLDEGEQIGFTTPTPVDSSMLEYISNYGNEIRLALGGVPDTALVQNTGSLFDYQQRYAQAFVTASKKAKAYIDKGIVKTYQLILRMAEVEGKITLPENAIEHLTWRHTGEVFPDSVNNTLTRSIVSRNLLRLGVNLNEALRFVFPSKSDNELDMMLDNGFAYELLKGISDIIGKMPIDENSQETVQKLLTLISKETNIDERNSITQPRSNRTNTNTDTRTTTNTNSQ